MGIYPCLTYRDIATAIDWLNNAFAGHRHLPPAFPMAIETGAPGCACVWPPGSGP